MRNSIYCVTNKTLMHLPSTLLCLSGDTKADLGPHPPPQPWRRKMPCACALSKKTLCCNKLWAQSPKSPSACCSPLPCQSQEETWRGHGGSHLQPSEVSLGGLSRETVSKTKTTETIWQLDRASQCLVRLRVSLNEIPHIEDENKSISKSE